MNCIHQPPRKGYQTAKMLLEKRYGDPHRLLGSCKKEIKKWQQLKLGEAPGLRKFSNNPHIISLLLSKLSVVKMRTNSIMEPSFSDLILFITEQTTFLNDPLFSRDAVAQKQEKKKKYKRKKKVNNFLAKTEIQTNEPFKLKAQNEEIDCPICGKSHGIEDCEDFLKLGIQERSKMIFIKNGCYGCYQRVSRMHNAKNCTNRNVCKVCNGKDATTLYGLVLRNDNSQK